MKRIHLLPLAISTAVPLALFTVLRLFPSIDPLFQSATFHVVVISVIAGCALAVALAAAIAASRIHRHEVVLVAGGCMTVGALLLAHGLVTPGIGHHAFNHWVGRLPTLAIAVFALALLATLLPPDVGVARVFASRSRLVLAAWALVLVGFATLVVVRPQLVAGHHPVSWEATATRIALWASIAVLSLTAWIYVKRARLGRDAVQYSLALACTMCISSCLSLQFGRLWRLSWWDYHAYLLIGFGAAVAAIVREYARARAIDDIMRPIATRDPFEQISNKYTESLKPLIAAVEAKDVYTYGHSMRTAELATRLGHRMKLDADTLRALAGGAYLHDIGKLALPDTILNKAGSLDPHERKVIERHPLDGYEIVRQASSLAHALPVVRHHHERFDGRGYPDGLTARAIPLTARIASVADVWDALTSRRAYRDAWREEEALAHILAGRGLHFDPVVVDAFVTMLAESGIRPHARVGETATVTFACETCHHLTGVAHQH